MTGSSTDCVVVDLSTLRVTNLQPAVELCHDLAAAAGARHVQPAERPLEAVPFNVIPVELPQPVQQVGCSIWDPSRLPVSSGDDGQPTANCQPWAVWIWMML